MEREVQTNKVRPIILSGGRGTRLWPVSRAGMAKQLAQVLNRETLLQNTMVRVQDSTVFGTATVITAYDDRFMVRDQLTAIGSDAEIVLEPARRDTLAAVLLSAEIAMRDDPDAVVAVMPSDHLIDCPDALASAISQAAAAVADGGICVIGVTPTEAATGYGYIRPGAERGNGVRSVATFVEKPDSTTARTLIDEGSLWNAGIFCFRARWLLDEVRNLEPEAVSLVAASVEHGKTDLGFFIPGEEFSAVRSVAFDVAVMERTNKALVVPTQFHWSDVGDWKAVWSVSQKDEDGVAKRGDTYAINTKDSLIFSSSRVVCTVGVKNVAVIETPDAVLVLSLDSAQDIKTLVSTLEKNGRSEALEHLRSYRPWGWYQTMDLGERFRVKRICVKPGAKLSLQRHHHRSEHWVVVKGTAEVTVGEQSGRIHENESIYIPLGEVHRLSNPGKIPVELIEVQSGSYLEEDDIERLEDVFGRAEVEQKWAAE